MPRPREFDEAVVLDLAMERFWRDGFEGTSMRDLADDMKISGASLYNAFGDKRTLYELALKRYLNETFRERIKRIEASVPPSQAINEFFGEIILRSVSDKKRRGCMLVNSAIESAPRDPSSGAITAVFLKEVEAFFLRSIIAGQRDGGIPESVSASDLSKSFLASFLGIRVLARIQPDLHLLKAIVRPLLALIEEPQDFSGQKFN